MNNATGQNSDDKTKYAAYDCPSGMKQFIFILLIHVFRPRNSKLLTVTKNTPVKNKHVIDVYHKKQRKNMEKCF